jgi:glycosyltransferase involved in cell wall biosynthesis
LKRLAIITTHPVQYYAPLFKILHEKGQIEIRVFYTWGEQSVQKHDPGFKKIVNWDLPLLEGYPFEFSVNTSAQPGSHHFFGIKTPELINRIKSFEPDALLILGWAYQSHLQLIRYFKGKLPVYFRGDSTLLDETGIIKPALKKIFLTWVYSQIDHAFYVGSRNKSYFKNYGVKEQNLTFLPHAVDNERFSSDRVIEVLKLREELGLKEEDILVLFAGKLEAKKDPLLLFKAFLLLKSPNVHLLFVGNGELEQQLKSESNKVAEGPKKVHFMGFQNQTRMPVIYQACELFCLPSKGPGESWGLAINEAMACSRAIIASDKVGAAADLIRPNYNGHIFESGNLTDLKEKLEKLTADKPKLQEYGRHSKQIISEWNFKTIASKLVTVINGSKHKSVQL